MSEGSRFSLALIVLSTIILFLYSYFYVNKKKKELDRIQDQRLIKYKNSECLYKGDIILNPKSLLSNPEPVRLIILKNKLLIGTKPLKVIPFSDVEDIKYNPVTAPSIIIRTNKGTFKVRGFSYEYSKYDSIVAKETDKIYAILKKTKN